jgi:hypothetical protein
MGYKLLGFAVWHGAKWYVKRRLPDPRLVAGVVAGLGVLVAAMAEARKLASPS